MGKFNRFFVVLTTFLLLQPRTCLEQPAAQASELPTIRGASAFSARPNHPFLYRVPATGGRPIAFAASGLPEGLRLDAKSGIIAGIVHSSMTKDVTLRVSNSAGNSERTLRIVIGDQLALTPPMGWSSWDFLQSEVTDRDLRAQADAMIATGLIDHGYSYINLDDGWSVKGGGEPGAPQPRDAQGNIRPNERFPDMKNLTTYLHTQGLRAGIYTSPGPLTCGQFEGSYEHEAQDAHQFSSWGFDLLKYDWCSYPAKDHSSAEMRKPYRQMGSLLKKENRDILFNLCQYGMSDVGTWGRYVDGQLWRTTGDLAWGRKGVYSSWDNIAADFEQPNSNGFIGPGGWNDLDDLLVGRIAYIPYNELPPNVHIDRRMPPPLTPDEQYSQMSLWSLLSAPLIVGGDLTTLSAFDIGILANDEVIAIDQDTLGRPARRAAGQGNLSVWVKDLADGSKAVGMFNLGDIEQEVGATSHDLGLTGRHRVRDLWRHKDLTEFDGSLRALVAPHGVVLMRLYPEVN